MFTLLTFFIWIAVVGHEVLPWYLWLEWIVEFLFYGWRIGWIRRG